MDEVEKCVSCSLQIRQYAPKTAAVPGGGAFSASSRRRFHGLAGGVLSGLSKDMV